MTNFKFVLAVICISTLTACDKSTENKPATPTPPVSAKEAIISVEKALNALIPNCQPKVTELVKGIELKEYTAMFNCETSDSKVTSLAIRNLGLQLTALLSTVTKAQKSDLDTNQRNYIQAIESETNLSIDSVRNSIKSSERNDQAITVQIITFLKKWDCEHQNTKPEIWPPHILMAKHNSCKKINLTNYESMYDANAEFLADLKSLNTDYLRPDSFPAVVVKILNSDFSNIYSSAKTTHIRSLDIDFPKYAVGPYYPKSIFIDGISLTAAKENPHLLEKILLVQEFFKADISKEKDSEFYKTLTNKIEEIHFNSNQQIPYELGITFVSEPCKIDPKLESGFNCNGQDYSGIRVNAKCNYANKSFGTLRVSIKNENLATANVQSAIAEVTRLIKESESAGNSYSKLESAISNFTYSNDLSPNPKIVTVKYRTLNSYQGSSIESYQNLIDRASKVLKGKKFANDSLYKVTFYILFDIDPLSPQLELKEVKSKYSGEITKAFIINFADSEETIAAKLNPFFAPAQ